MIWNLEVFGRRGPQSLAAMRWQTAMVAADDHVQLPQGGFCRIEAWLLSLLVAEQAVRNVSDTGLSFVTGMEEVHGVC